MNSVEFKCPGCICHLKIKVGTPIVSMNPHSCVLVLEHSGQVICGSCGTVSVLCMAPEQSLTLGMHTLGRDPKSLVVVPGGRTQ